MDKKFEEMLKRNMDDYFFLKYIEFKKENQRTFKKYNWNEVQIKKKIIQQNLKKLCIFYANNIKE